MEGDENEGEMDGMKGDENVRGCVGYWGDTQHILVLVGVVQIKGLSRQQFL